MKRAEVNALLDSDLPAFLEANGLLSAFTEGRLVCHNCGRVVDKENVHAIFKKSGKVIFCCNLAACIYSHKEGKSE